MEKLEYDIVVVGAGPGGSSTAKNAAERGASVLLLEKRHEIGIPVRCGEGLSLESIEESGLKPHPSWARQEIDGAFLYSPSMKKVTAKYPKALGYILDRHVFDKMLAMRAADKGADVKTGVRVTGLIKEGDKITGITAKDKEQVSYEIKSKIVVGADGVEGLVGKWAGIDTTQKLTDLCTGFQYEMTNIKFEDPKMLEVYIGNEIAPGGYIWVFPKSDRSANVGIGIRAYKKGQAKALLDSWIKKMPGLKNGSIVSINGGAIPVGAPLEKIVGNGIMLVGDTAHQVNAVHGGGIGEALEAGIFAGTVAAECVKKGDCSENALVRYPTEWFETAGNKLAKLVRLRRVIENMNDADFDFLAEQLSGDDIINLTTAKKFESLSKFLLKRPSLLRFVPILLGKK